LLGLALERLDGRRDDEIVYLECFARTGVDPLASKDGCVEPAPFSPSVASALAALEGADRDMLTLDAWAGLSTAAIAQITGLTNQAVAARVDAARQLVREHLGAGATDGAAG
jgi:DNA-directed RNA polymerase specialized sigma24 family protein